MTLQEMIETIAKTGYEVKICGQVGMGNTHSPFLIEDFPCKTLTNQIAGGYYPPITSFRLLTS
jgi:hypothetical protein